MRGDEDSGRSHAAEVALAFVGLLWLTHGLDFVLYEALPKIVVRVFALTLFVASAGFLLANRSGRGEAWSQTWPIWIAPLLALLSILWSDVPSLTLRRSTALLGSTCFGVFLALRLDLEERIRLIAAGMAIIAVLSVLRVVLAPDSGLMEAYGTKVWRGVFGHKNYLGRAMALGALTFLLLSFRSGLLRWATVGVGVCIAITLACHSASATISLAITLTAAAAFRMAQCMPAKRRPQALAVIALAALVGTGLAVAFADQVLAPLGRDATLTGRLNIWQASWLAIRLQPWLGYGYGAVWYTDQPGAGQIVTHHTGFDPLTAHSGFFDLLLELGFLGLAAFGIPFVLCASGSIVRVVRQDSPIYLWPAAYLIFFTVANVAESELLRQNSIFWVLFVATVIDLRLPKASFPQAGNPGGEGTAATQMTSTGLCA